ncbi:MAG: hypothetical protein OI860_00020 (plasmid) [Candidatus Methanoperedens sp.]|uniref:hypothetical protein n=1 Tax=Candidatus Methanoperedens sp. BLZ2 TaxID=2035255 RepID=UPI000BE467FD|nr:hypothetical protein [Candidatus Methanoperedens sp. BLZ2]KAB2946397.1 MAG: hypothetical protein F9K14_07380 [Candidatus Methanoperedens sp.]MBZ0175634.1 hypothetical protein [Candidatus Methanoperedens nitroreducens]WAH95096.1 MAG: hypothetical protein OI863_00445 [Candidatus Methanoperedens sp.]WAM22182.1 MAG: hypothetical protein OI860_00020 [Candidatus Methanoperedens sp.]
MQEILEKHCLNENANGLLLLSMPTGFGKTHNVLDFIYKHYKDFVAHNRKIFFITNLKKNLPYQKLQDRFRDDHAEDAYDQHVLFIDSNADAVINHLLSVDAQIPDQFKTKDYTHLKSFIETLKNGKRPSKMVKEALENEISEKLEPAFRESIQVYLHREFRTKKERLNAIKKDSNYQWIGNLYPAVFTDEKTILFLSMDKFIRKNTTLVERSYYFHERLLEKAVVFIDEFDATKENVLRSIIESGARHRINLLDLFLNIHNHLMESEYPESLLRESEQRRKISDGKNWRSPNEMIEIFRQKSDDIFKKYNLQHTCKSHEDFSYNKRNFLFYDFQFHHILNARNKRIEVVQDVKNRTNWIKTLEAGKEGSGINIRSLLSEIAGFLTYFQRRVSYLADNYCHLKIEDDTSQEVFPYEYAVRTVLYNFGLDADIVDFLTNNIIEGSMLSDPRSKNNAIQQKGFYDAGFRYYDIVDSDEHDTLSKIYMYNFYRTPESFLVGICSKAMVVGTSATAGLYTNIGNYDLEYLHSRLGQAFFRISGGPLDRIKNQFLETTRGYDQISIKTEFIGSDNPEETLTKLQSLLEDEEAAIALRNKVIYSNPDADKQKIEFIFSRYVRSLIVWKYFLDNPGIHAFFCFFNKFPKPDDPEFDLDVIRKYAELIQDGLTSVGNEPVHETVIVLTGDDFNDNKIGLLSELGGGKRRFIFSTYPTIGAGQNLQYPIPKSVHPIHINAFPARSEMDVEAIYLDRPTNLLVNIFKDNIDNEQFIKYLFQLEFLLENGAISPKEFNSKLDEAFHLFVGKRRQKKRAEDFTNLYQTEAYTRFLNKIVIQAIGRICRTNMKAPTIHILADSSIRRHLARFSLGDEIIPVREYTALLESAGETTVIPANIVQHQNRASNRSNTTAAFIHRQLKIQWTEDSIKQWQELRKYVLKHPTISEKEKCNSNWSLIYVELPSPRCSYRFTQEKDYRDTEVFFSNDKGKQEVSEQTARLPELMLIEPLRKLFQENNWATSFPESKLILTPPMFNNIYKGALGEVCGRHIIQDILKINLNELEVSEFEKFDFKTENNIYFDFKLWNDQTAVSADEHIPKIRRKMEDCHANRVFIINILGKSGDEFHPIISTDGRIIEVPFICQGNSFNEEALKFIMEEYHK